MNQPFLHESNEFFKSHVIDEKGNLLKAKKNDEDKKKKKKDDEDLSGEKEIPKKKPDVGMKDVDKME